MGGGESGTPDEDPPPPPPLPPLAIALPGAGPGVSRVLVGVMKKNAELWILAIHAVATSCYIGAALDQRPLGRFIFAALGLLGQFVVAWWLIWRSMERP